MRFLYEYRTPDNARHEGVIRAPDRETAFQSLKAQGIRPGKLYEAPGLLNKLFGKGKRWITIAVLALALVAAILMTGAERRAARHEALVLPRAQLYGDPVIIGEAMRMGWFNEFPTVGERHLAKHAIPGMNCGCGELNAANKQRIADSILKHLHEPVPIRPDDMVESATMKRMVNGMKEEAADYVAAGGSIDKYLDRLEIRQKAEFAIYDKLRREILKTSDESVRKAKNAELRARGLPLVDDTE